MTQPAVFDHGHSTEVPSTLDHLQHRSIESLIQDADQVFDVLATANRLTEVLFSISPKDNDDVVAHTAAEALDTLTVAYCDLVALAVVKTLAEGVEPHPLVVAHGRVANSFAEVLNARREAGTLKVVNV